ncbi:peroxiredoxin [Pyrobaculum sp. 3827-6]|uniref:peroxiredoxin n=1 Tax=Pyrobaculum sp. 3827-6 TaxID=2983604 RepID=UPI0021DAD98C|nr:peroxiredoxin [Pyrobaculum sp. 3827-6]MCU7788048.1 peroxiredoxin [Pyrobaculum sp. 3827-6]
MPKAVIILADNDIARAYHALVIALGQGAWVRGLFATGLGALIFSRRPRSRLIGLPLLASLYIRWKLRKIGAKRLEELAAECLRSGVYVYVDEPVTKMLGVTPMDGVAVAGSLTFLALARDADLVLAF